LFVIYIEFLTKYNPQHILPTENTQLDNPKETSLNVAKNLKSMALTLFFLMPIMVLIALLNPTLVYFPISGFYLAGLTMTMAVLMYAFASFDFQYIQKQAKPWISVGSAETITTTYSHLIKFWLGVQSSDVKEVIVNLKNLPRTSYFLGRWTVYLRESDRLELWHDHAMFGDQWYYIKY
ncbi:TPA: hypothetical protein DCZ81_03500, partial [Candidatus Collierbacteria bacterium]|nr:hypothetical protein [Candidatus Collierbacteria bacterium]